MKLRVLHVTPDDKFFDLVIPKWDNDIFENRAILFANNKNYQIKYIKATNLVKIIWSDMMAKDCLMSNDYDIVLFHSLPSKLYKYFKYIPEDKIVIWWGWGYDIYFQSQGLSPFIKVDLYKPLTFNYVESVSSKILRFLHEMRWFFLKPYNIKRRNYVLSRIDYFQPGLDYEYRLMKQVNTFKAKEFYDLPVGSSYPVGFPYDNICMKESNGNILLGNSASPTNNHLDLLHIIQAKKQSGQQILIPLSYGDSKYANWLINRIDRKNVQTILDFMPLDEYMKLFDSCSYAVIGSIRQQAMWNVFYALSRGIKVFLYKDSIMYKSLINMGYVVYAIDDITSNSFEIPLSPAENEINRQAQEKEAIRRRNVYNVFVREMTKRHIQI